MILSGKKKKNYELNEYKLLTLVKSLPWTLIYLWSGGRLKEVPVVTKNTEHSQRLELVWVIQNQTKADRQKIKRTAIN